MVPNPAGRPRTSIRDRVFPYLVITPAPMTHDLVGRPLIGPCLIWQRAIQRGYGVTSRPDRGSGRSLRVHRVLYEMFVGPIGDQLDHLCRVKSCASPAHLEDVTGAVNTARAIRPPGPRGPKKNRQTACRRGHEYNEVNTRIERQRNGDICRKCRICERDRLRNKRHARGLKKPGPRPRTTQSS